VVAGLESPLHALAHEGRVVAGILPRPLPGAALDGSLDRNGALTMRIAKILAVVYAAFLIVWFWATRVRWNGR
jgi:hypothetical protein